MRDSRRFSTFLAVTLLVTGLLFGCARQAPPIAPEDGALSALAGENELVDDLVDFAKMHARSGHLTIYKDTPERFGGDIARLGMTAAATSQPGTQHIVYKTPTDMSSFTAQSYFNYQAQEDFRFYASSDGVTYTRLSPERDDNNGQRTAGWLPVSYRAPVPEGTRYLKIEFGATNANWDPQLGQVVITYLTEPETDIVEDNLNDFSKIHTRTEQLKLQTDTPEKFGGDPSRLVRNNVTTSESIVYKRDSSISSVVASTYLHVNGSPSDFKFYTSDDGVSFSKLGVARTILANPVDPGWQHIEYKAASLPTGTTYVKIEFGSASNAWSAQISRVVLNSSVTEARLLATLKQEHPRVLASREDFADLKMRIAADPTLSRWYTRIRQNAQQILAEPVSRYEKPDGRRLLDVSRKVLSRMYTLGLLYQLDGDQAYVDRAWNELNAAAAFPDWNPDHFLDTAEMTHAFGIGYDWFYHAWTPEQREVIREAILDKGVALALNAYRGDRSGVPERWGWVGGSNNWNIVSNGGISVGMLAIADEAPELAEEVLAVGLASIQNGLARFEPDGSYVEGLNYWDYASAYAVYYLAASKSALGTDHGLLDKYTLDQTGDFPVFLSSQGRVFNYGDTNNGPIRAHQLFWLAQQFDKPLYNRYQLEAANPHPLDLVWYDSGLNAPSANLPLDRYFEDGKVVSFRNSWTDPEAIFTGLKAGFNRTGHSDLDNGTFALDALGVRWAEDLGIEDYDLPGYFDDGPTGQRWTYYRKRAEGQNTLVINPGMGAEQLVTATAEITAFESTPEEAIAITDLTPNYPEANQVSRGLALFNYRREVLIQDEITLRQPGDIWWFMHTKTQIEVQQGGQSAILQQGNQRLWAQIVSPQNASFVVMDAAPLPTSPNPAGQNPNDGIRKLAIHLEDTTVSTITVRFVPLRSGDVPPTQTPRALPLADWASSGPTDGAALATLGELTVAGTPLDGFSPTRFTYSVKLPAGTTEVPVVAATAANAADTVVVRQAERVPGQASIEVSSSDGSTATAIYYLNFTVAPTIGKPDDVPQLPVISVRASSFQEGNGPENALDGNLATRWSAEGEQWIEFDLGSQAEVQLVAAAWLNGDQRQTIFDLEASNDGTDWTTLYSGRSSGITKDYEVYNFVDTQARYVRIRGYGNTQSGWNSLNEVALFGRMLDTTPPTITASRSPDANANGWNNVDVTVRFECADDESGVASCPEPVTLTSEGAEQSVTGTAVDNAGNQASATVEGLSIDKTAPTVTYGGNEGSYTVDGVIELTCSTSDALSGIASDTCENMSGPAYEFDLGMNTVSATATDNAGNTGEGSASFEVVVTYDSLGSLTERLVEGPSSGGVSQSLRAKLEAAEDAEARGDEAAKLGALNAYKNQVASSSRHLSAEEQEVLVRLANAL